MFYFNANIDVKPCAVTVPFMVYCKPVMKVYMCYFVDTFKNKF